MAPNGFGGGITTILMILPFLFIIAGVAYMAVATPGRKAQRHRSVRVLPVGAQHPLSHVRTKMKPVTTQPARQAEQKAAPRRRSEAPWLRSVD